MTSGGKKSPSMMNGSLLISQTTSKKAKLIKKRTQPYFDGIQLQQEEGEEISIIETNNNLVEDDDHFDLSELQHHQPQLKHVKSLQTAVQSSRGKIFNQQHYRQQHLKISDLSSVVDNKRRLLHKQQSCQQDDRRDFMIGGGLLASDLTTKGKRQFKLADHSQKSYAEQDRQLILP